MTPLALCEFPLHRCLCTHCVVMSTPRECICCKEIVEVVNKLSEVETDMTCITQHPGFASVCLDVWVLQTAYFQYRQHYGTYIAPVNE